ncbi:MAG: hypothetical protein F4213_03215 [Boseongicola sp. SB0677_bin_26]|nr:hypothetical protein [Boseongicola sp. SB0665_bin_10]MYG25024.1 hypothetical protein [Boseongicola sp. SB0677_bin_26]
MTDGLIKWSGTSRVLGPALAVLLLVASPAQAIFGGGRGCPWNVATKPHVTKENERVRAQVRDSIEQQTIELNDHLTVTMQRHAQENSAHQRMQAEANQRIEDAAQVNATQRMRDEFRAKAESGTFDPARDSCRLVDMFGRSGGSGPAVTGSDVVGKAAKELSGDDPAVAEGGVPLTRSRVDAWQDYHDWNGRQDATTDWGIVTEQPTLDMGDPDTEAVITEIILNTIDNTPPPRLSDSDLLSPEGLDEQVRRNEIRARQRAAEEVIAMVLNMRTGLPGADTETFRAMATESAYNSGSSSAPVFTRPIGDSLSELQQLDILTVWNYAPKGERLETLTNSGGMNVQAWLYEIHRLLAVSNRLDYLALELASRDALVNAALLATLNDN